MEVLEYKYDNIEAKIITCHTCGSRLKITMNDLEDSRYYCKDYYVAGNVRCPVCHTGNFVNWYDETPD